MVVAQRFVPHQEPSVLAVVPPYPRLPLVPDTLEERPMHSSLHRSAIVGMIEPVAPFLRRDTFVERHPEVVERGTVHHQHRAVRAHHADQLWHVIDEQPQFPFVAHDARLDARALEDLLPEGFIDRGQFSGPLDDRSFELLGGPTPLADIPRLLKGNRSLVA